MRFVFVMKTMEISVCTTKVVGEHHGTDQLWRDAKAPHDVEKDVIRAANVAYSGYSTTATKSRGQANPTTATESAAEASPSHAPQQDCSSRRGGAAMARRREQFANCIERRCVPGGKRHSRIKFQKQAPP